MGGWLHFAKNKHILIQFGIGVLIRVLHFVTILFAFFHYSSIAPAFISIALDCFLSIGIACRFVVLLKIVLAFI